MPARQLRRVSFLIVCVCAVAEHGLQTHVCIFSGTASGNRRKPRPCGFYLAEMALAPSCEGWKSGDLLCRCLEFHIRQKGEMFFS